MLWMRQWSMTAAMQATSALGEGPLFLLDFALRGARVLVWLSLWRLILGGHQGELPMSLDAVLTYALISEVFAEQLSVRSRLQHAFWQGSIANHFFRPMGLVSQFAAGLLGDWLLGLVLFSLPLLALAPLLGVNPLPADALRGLLFGASLVLAIAIGLAFDFFYAALMVALEQPVWLIEFARRALTGLLAGAVIPLALLPFGLGALLEWLPFAALAWAPLAIYTGAGEPLRLLALQLFWAAVLWPLTLWFFSRHREKVTGHGG